MPAESICIFVPAGTHERNGLGVIVCGFVRTARGTRDGERN